MNYYQENDPVFTPSQMTQLMYSTFINIVTVKQYRFRGEMLLQQVIDLLEKIYDVDSDEYDQQELIASIYRYNKMRPTGIYFVSAWTEELDKEYDMSEDKEDEDE